MFRNYLLMAWRNLKRYQVFSLINILGLAIGMAACLLILQYVNFELSYDEVHPLKNDLYRIQYNQYKDGKLEFESATTVPAIGPAMKENFPQVQEFARLFSVSPRIVSYGNARFRESKIKVAEPAFLKLFSFPFVKGEAATALTEPHTAAISETTARKYFGQQDPMGKVIQLNGKESFQIKGVFKDVPPNSHLKFDLLLSWKNYFGENKKMEHEAWYWYDFYTYVLLAPATDRHVFQGILNQWLARDRKEDWQKNGITQQFRLQPLTDIHLYSRLLQEDQPRETGQGNVVYFLMIVGVFILIVAWINFINLSTARSVARAKEVGVRKVLGAAHRQLMSQFLAEAWLINLLALALAFTIAQLTLPYLWQLMGVPGRTLLPTIELVGLGVALWGIGTFVSGFYPALVLSSFAPVRVLKEGIITEPGRISLRQGLVVFQFAVSVALGAGMLAVYQQLTFMRAQDLGVHIDQTLVIKGPGVVEEDSLYDGALLAFKTELLTQPGIGSLTISSNIPGEEVNWMNVIARIQPKLPDEKPLPIFIVGVDPEYFNAFGIKFVAGGNFSWDLGSTQQALVLNEAAIHLLGFRNAREALGQLVNFRGKDRPIIGITEDYHQMSLKEVVKPIAFTCLPVKQGAYFSIRLGANTLAGTLPFIQEKWKQYFPGNPLEYFFLDEFFNQQYQSDQRFGQLFALFVGLAILVACLGLLGLVSFLTVQRTKEIGVRKVLGASVSNILLLLSKDFLGLILMANLVAWPLAYWGIHQWLEKYPFRIELNIWLFVLPALLVLLIALLTVSLQTIKAARANPVKALRYE